MSLKYGHWVLGYHGCERAHCMEFVKGERAMQASRNYYDWLGHGIYFWENSCSRALEFARSRRHPTPLKEPFVIGAVIDLGYCLDLLQAEGLEALKDAYDEFARSWESSGIAPLKNSLNEHDVPLIRQLDCAVFEWLHSAADDAGEPAFDTVRAAFWEGEELYPGAGFRSKNHVQICVRNPQMIRGVFIPPEMGDLSIESE
jgi:hypothetical protein